MNAAIIYLAILCTVLVVALQMTILDNNKIITAEPFEVVSDTSKYSCVISEANEDLSLNCLKVK